MGSLEGALEIKTNDLLLCKCSISHVKHEEEVPLGILISQCFSLFRPTVLIRLFNNTIVFLWAPNVHGQYSRLINCDAYDNWDAYNQNKYE